MNSLLQQFFNIGFIREGLLASPDNNLMSLDESYLYQLKNIFAFLKASDRKYHNPKNFTNIFKNYDNQVMNVTEQMDVDEFYNLLIDRLEPYLSNTKYENLFKFVFSGIISNEIIGKGGCPHFSETKEFFQSIILQVKNKKNIEESLDAFILGEMMEGDNSYNCERCEKKVSALKRQCFKKLPRVLTLVLKRFEYDYDTMLKNKINDYCEFPLELNMEKYTQEFLMKKYNEKLSDEEGNDSNNNNQKLNNEYLYDLSGVIIHTGTTERGHYYSFAKKENNQWLEFNDTNVSPFNLEDLEDEAFGGTQYYYNNKTGKNELVEKSTNAYVLFYTRKDVGKLQEEIKYTMDIDSNSNNNSIASFNIIDNNKERDTETENYIKILKDNSKYSNIQPNIIESIKTDNFQYWVSKMIFSNEYIDFIKDIILNYNSNLSQIYLMHMLAKNEFNNVDYQDFIRIYENRIKEISGEKNLKNSQIYFSNTGESSINKSININTLNSSINTKVNNYNVLNSNTKNIVLDLNCESTFKNEKYSYENIRMRRFKKLFNIQDSSNPDLKMNNLEIYFKKLSDFYAYNTNINKDLLITNIKRKKKASTLSFKTKYKSSNPNKLNNSNNQNSNNRIYADNNISNLIPEESEIQLPLENIYESSNLKNKTLITKSYSIVLELINSYTKDELKSELFKFLVIFFFTTVLRCKDKNLIPSFYEIIKTQMNLNVENALWLIEEFSNMELIQEFLMECPLPEIKRITAGLIYSALLKICRNSRYKNNFINTNDFVIIDKNDLISFENLNEKTSINDNNQIESVQNFICSLLNLISKKNKFPNKDFNTIYFIIWRYSTIGFEQKQFLYNVGIVKFIVGHLKIRNKFENNVNLEECFKVIIRIPKNNDLVNKNPIKPEKLTIIEDLLEKKQIDKNNYSSDNYLLITLFEILSASNYAVKFNQVTNGAENYEIKMDLENNNLNTNNNNENRVINLNDEIIRLISLEDKDHLRMYALEANRTRQSSVYFINLINSLCHNNEAFSNRLSDSFYELFKNLDYDELISLTKPFKSFISLNDNLADNRVFIYNFLNLFFIKI